jgi:hypothetical protein
MRMEIRIVPVQYHAARLTAVLVTAAIRAARHSEIVRDEPVCENTTQVVPGPLVVGVRVEGVSPRFPGTFGRGSRPCVRERDRRYRGGENRQRRDAESCCCRTVISDEVVDHSRGSDAAASGEEEVDGASVACAYDG